LRVEVVAGIRIVKTSARIEPALESS